MLDTKNKWHAVALVVGILFIAANLRVPFTGIAPVLPLIQNDFGLSNSALGLLTSLPLLAFAAFSPLSASVAHKFGIERTLFGALVVISLGILLRSAGSAWALYAGTILIGTGIALGNVLLPGLIKRDFSKNMASMTGAYAITMGASGAVGSAVIIPLTQAWGWPIALSLLVAVPLFALVLWLPQLKKHDPVNLFRSKKISNRGRLEIASGMAGHTVHGPECDAFLCRCRLAAYYSDRPWHIGHTSRIGARNASTRYGNSGLDISSHASPPERPEASGRNDQSAGCHIPDRTYLCAKPSHVMGRAFGLWLWR